MLDSAYSILSLQLYVGDVGVQFTVLAWYLSIRVVGVGIVLARFRTCNTDLARACALDIEIGIVHILIIAVCRYYPCEIPLI